MKRTNNYTFGMHLSGFAGHIFTFGNIIIPYILWQLKKENNSIIDNQGKEVVNFNITFLLYQIIAGLTIIPSLLNQTGIKQNISIFHQNINLPFQLPVMAISLISILLITKYALILIAAIKTKKGEMYQYPFTIKFIK